MKNFFLVASLYMITGATMAQKTYNLQFKPNTGDKYTAATTTKATITQSVMGQDMVIGMDYNMNMLYEVNKEGDNTVLKMTYEKLGMDMDAMGQKIQMSSDSQDDNPANKPFQSLKGGSISTIINSHGEVIDVKGTDDLLKRMGDISETEKETLKGFVSKDAIKSTTETFMKIFPANPVKVGDSWQITSLVQTPYKLKLNTHYKLIKVENGIAYIDVAGTVSTDGAQAMKMNGMDINIDLSGDQNGTIQVNEVTGMTQVAQVKQNLKGKMDVMGQEVPMAVASDTKVEVVKK